jgi:hypothetical protein
MLQLRPNRASFCKGSETGLTPAERPCKRVLVSTSVFRYRGVVKPGPHSGTRRRWKGAQVAIQGV